MVQTFEHLAKQILQVPGNHRVVAVDGRSASGKTTFAKALASALKAPIVHTDDVAWHHSFFDWWPLLIEHILLPYKAGQAVHWMPEAWQSKGRSGAIVVPVAPVLIVEGVSASRRELASYLDLTIWLETDPQLAQQRGLLRDGPEGYDFWFEWQIAEVPLLEADKPWERADLIVDGAPAISVDTATEFVVVQDRGKKLTR